MLYRDHKSQQLEVNWLAFSSSDFGSLSQRRVPRKAPQLDFGLSANPRHPKHFNLFGLGKVHEVPDDSNSIGPRIQFGILFRICGSHDADGVWATFGFCLSRTSQIGGGGGNVRVVSFWCSSLKHQEGCLQP